MIVLTVDDQKTMRMLSASIVKQMGHEVIEAVCCEDAISYCRKNRVDLILLDVEMTGINDLKLQKPFGPILHPDFRLYF
jgi:CheY-like chemotaxis protein